MNVIHWPIQDMVKDRLKTIPSKGVNIKRTLVNSFFAQRKWA